MNSMLGDIWKNLKLKGGEAPLRFGMNEKGAIPLIVFLVVAFVLVLALPAIIMEAFPIVKLLFQVMMAFLLYAIVRSYLGSSPLTLIITAILVYVLVFKYTYITSAAWIFQTILMFAGFSVMIWVLGLSMRKH